jgi:hypothetical protein
LLIFWPIKLREFFCLYLVLVEISFVFFFEFIFRYSATRRIR